MVGNRKGEVRTAWSKCHQRANIKKAGHSRQREQHVCRYKRLAEGCGMPECPNIVGSDRQRGCQRPQGWYFHPASCSGLSCPSLQASRTSSVQISVPGTGPECGTEAGAWVREKDFVIGYRDKDLRGWCYSGGEGAATGKNSRKRIMGELEALQILAIHPWTGRFSGCRKGREGSACMWRVLFLLHLHLEI